MKNMVWLGSYICGFIGGAVCSVLVFRKYYRDIANDEIKSVKELYSLPYVIEPCSSKTSEGNSAEKDVEESETGQIDYDEIEKQEIHTTYTNYTDKYSGGGEADYILNTLAESQHPEDDSSNKKNKKKKKGIRLIKSEDYDGYPQYRKLTVYYYLGDGRIADEYDEEILKGTDDRSLGKYKDHIPDEILDKYGFISDDNQANVFIRNEDLGIDFMVIKDFGTFSDFNKEE